MSDLPIIMSAPMVRVLLREAEAPGTGKTMTRRLAWQDKPDRRTKEHRPSRSPWQRVKPGDRLWVRENFCNQQVSRYRGWSGDKPANRLLVCIDYVADGHREHFDLVDRIDLPKILTKRGRGESGKETVILPCIHMPRQVSRLTLIVTATKIERLHTISEADAIAEGIEQKVIGCDGGEGRQESTIAYSDDFDRGASTNARDHYRLLWIWLHGKESWLANPEVVALTFRVHPVGIDAMPKEKVA